MNKKNIIIHYNYMKTIYKLLENNLIINIYNDKNDNTLKDIRSIINKTLNKKLFSVNTVTIFLNGIKLGTIYSTNYYLKSIIKKQNTIKETNSFFSPNYYIELNP